MKYSSIFKRENVPYIATMVLCALLVFIGYRYYTLNTEMKFLKNESETSIAILQERISLLDDSLLNSKNQNTDLSRKLDGEKAQNDNLGAQIQSISSTVGDLYKLSKTDRELLQKYSNIYFLNENYVPSSLSSIDVSFLYRTDKSETIHTTIKPFLENMIRVAQAESVPLLILSAYRSFSTQAVLKSQYKVVYGTTAANKFSADQGYSEHQLGSTVDFTTPKGGEVLEGFDKTVSYTWLVNNAHRYGFLLSYPKGNAFYKFEPWHWRYVGVELATRLHNENKYFYDMDQRQINEYLVKIFD